ncbi:MAG: thioredoxin-disulfide reductase [Oscillospiraceae bacterium]|nr:thioredoxin-disulfide reductase [Oscillospiraceae bacterium]
MDRSYDVIVIGGGPAGYTAALYTARSGYRTLVIEKIAPGGQMTQTTQIDNYPGFPDGVDGITLGMQMQAGAARFGVETEYSEVKRVNLTGAVKEIETTGGTFKARAVVVATGATHRHLGVEGEEALVGRGVGYCAACDAMFYRGKTVAVVGGGNTAAAAALVLSRIARQVHLIHRRDSLRATRVYHQSLEQAENITFHWNATVQQLLAEQKLTGVVLENVQTGQRQTLSVDGLFVSIGQSPATALFEGQLELDGQGYIVADETTKTNIDGVYAVGDVRTKQVRQVITAAADGAAAAHQIESYLM